MKPTHTIVNDYINLLLPLKENDVSRAYHVPRSPRYDPDTAVVEQIVLSVTPTPGVYSLIGHPFDRSTTGPTRPYPQIYPRRPRTICFLHRPFELDRRNVRSGTLVLSSHTSFDEVLTVGWNPVLAGRLGLNVAEASCIQGYKGDLERKIGIVGEVSLLRAQLLRDVQAEFGGVEFALEGLSDAIHVVAIMNAFNEEEVHRVLEVAHARGWIPREESGENILYITGQPRVAGLEAAKLLGMSVVCVGHRQAEDWGIRYIAAQLRNTFPTIRVEEVYEEEIPIVRKAKVEVAKTSLDD
ncbi:hypothetical protein T440DRAFT_7047 [Plenodomus tracheiphilus IPT5]|uniref:Ngg1p interacting factor 3 nif3 protein n=1 Tax=Plenodomus tracheiphilus IPT5 TaxID=1408161 RepID=A0A6A7BMR1_9PLEO|nr:hypothetical protein T440DRAFT_7047 [Plenodomus tracheiphilus IPT5]